MHSKMSPGLILSYSWNIVKGSCKFGIIILLPLYMSILEILFTNANP